MSAPHPEFVESEAAQRLAPGVRRYLVTVEQGRLSLPAGTLLEEVRRFEDWQHPACIDAQTRILVAELRILQGPRAGESVLVDLEAGWDGQEPFPGSRPTWLTPVLTHRSSAFATR